MIEYIKGDLFETDVKLIAHGCNALGVMGGGVAAIVRQRFPEAYEQYRKELFNETLQLGGVCFVDSNGKTIANAITQASIGSGVQVSYAAIKSTMKLIREYMDENGITEVAMPKIGAGLAGGDWNIIEDTINATFPHLTVKVYVLE